MNTLSEFLERYDALGDEDLDGIKEAAHLAARDRIEYGGRGQTREQWTAAERAWHALSPDAQRLCRDAVDLWDYLVDAARVEAAENGLEVETVDALFDSHASEWLVRDAAIAASYGPRFVMPE